MTTQSKIRISGYFSPVPRKRLCQGVAALLLLQIPLVCTGCESMPVADSADNNRLAGDTKQLDDPRELVRKLKAAGVPDSLNGRGWNPSRSGDGRWIAILLKGFAIDQYSENEVSCWFESTNRDEVQHFELNAELRNPRVNADGVMKLFERAVYTVYPDAPDSLMRAIHRKRAWSGGGWELEKIEYGNRFNGYQLMLTWRK